MSKASRRLRRQAVSATKSRAFELSVFALGASLLAPLAIAQEQDASNTAETQTTTKSDADMTEILVTGIRKALQTSQEIKKSADTVVDSITASDIGAFPDKSVAEALQRISGITVTRFAASGDTTHFSAEPSGIVIRGLPQVRSEFNGRDSFNANSSRGLSFGDVSPELMAGVDTYKNATADMIEGGIAGTVNLRTHVPFDSQGFVAAFSGELGYGDLAEQTKPSGSFLISNRWETGIGDFGLMANAAYSSVVTESQGVQIGRYYRFDGVAQYGGGTKWIPIGIDIRENTYTRERRGGSIAAQWKSPEDAFLLTFQYNRSEYQNDWQEYALASSGFVDTSRSPQDDPKTAALQTAPDGTRPYTFDSRGVFTGGVLADSVNAWAGPVDQVGLAHEGGYTTSAPGGGTFLNWFCYSWSTTDACPTTRGIGLSADTRFSKQENVTEDYSSNLRWNVNERLGLNFDIQHIKSTVDNFDNSTDSKTFANLDLDLTGSKPKFNILAPTGFGMTAGGFSDPANYFHEWTMEHAEQSEGTENAYRLDADIAIGAGWLDALRVGVRRAEREQDINWSKYNWGSVQPLWGVEADDSYFMGQGRWVDSGTAVKWGSDLVGGGVFGGGTFIHPSHAIVDDYAANRALFEGHSHDWVPLASRTNCPVVPGTLFCPVEQQNVTEDTDAAYVMLKFGNDETKIGNVSVKGNIGVRWVKTSVEAAGGIAFPLWTPPTPPGPPVPGEPERTDPLTLTPLDDIAFMNGGTIQQTGGADHVNWLPSFNVRFGLTDQQFVRFALSRALARPDMGLYKNYLGVSRAGTTCGGGVVYEVPDDCTSNPVAYTPQYNAEAGNPALKSTTADQLDLTYEYYFSNTGSLTTALFYKKFNDYIQYGDFEREFTNNGVTRTVSVRGPITGDGASLKGFEVAYQQFLDALPAPWSGFGFQTNFTYVENHGITNSSLSSVAGDGTVTQSPLITFTNLPLEGYSKTSYNVVLMFEQEKYSARLAYNWRDQYLISQSDCCIKLPIWQDAYGQLDGSVHYKPSGNWDVFLDVQNMLKQETVLRQQVNNQGLTLPRSWFTNDRRLQLGVRYRIQ